jgi:copper chaperone CopZ
MAKVTLQIPRISCQGCVANIDNILNSLSGVQTVNIRLGERSATIFYDPSALSLETILDTLEAAEFPATVLD